jgi:hypothetical protein
LTTETRTTIECSDIVAVEFECANCGTRTVRKLTTDNYVPETCKSGLCVNTTTFFAESSIEYAELLHALNLIGKYSVAPKKRPFVLRFELKPSGSQMSKGQP